MTMELVELYGAIYAAMALMLIILQTIRRIVWVARQRLGFLLMQYFLLPLVFPRARFLGNITRLRFCFQLAYLAINITINILGAKSLRDAGIKSATLSTINFSLLLASQPALISDLMGMSLRTYLRIHSMISLVMSAQVLTHLAILLAEKKVSIQSGTQLYGLLAAVALSLILIFVCFRRLFYELFIKSHHILAIGAFYTIWCHLSTGTTWLRYYLLGGAATFVITLLTHILFMLVTNISIHRPLPRATIIPYKGAVKIKVSNIRPLKVRAGQFFQLRIPGVSIWSLLQNHPFAVAWWDENEHGYATSLYFLIEAQSGFTARLSQHASSNRTYLTWIDGPYGGPIDFGGYGCVLMFASGVGIAAQIPYIKEILKQRHQWRSSIRNICLAWEVNDSSQLNWVGDWMQELLRQDQGGYILRILLFMPKSSNSHEKYGIHERIEILPIEMDVYSVIEDEIQTRGGKMMITVASRHRTRDEVRSAIMRHIRNIGTANPEGEKTSSEEKALDKSHSESAVYIESMQVRIEDLIRSFHEKQTKDAVDQKVDSLIHSIHMFQKNACLGSKISINRVESVSFVELLFQPRRGKWNPEQSV